VPPNPSKTNDWIKTTDFKTPLKEILRGLLLLPHKDSFTYRLIRKQLNLPKFQFQVVALIFLIKSKSVLIMPSPQLNNIRVVIIGLGYVGLPLAVEFGKKYLTVGFDINKERVAELERGFDRTRETSTEGINAATKLSFVTSLDSVEKPFGTPTVPPSPIGQTSVLQPTNIYIVTVPTPIDQFKKPDLRPLISASTMIGKVLQRSDVVIYESTVYPGCTEEDCVPVLEQISGLTFNQDFFCGYSPERINPGDKKNTLTKILKITSGSTPEIAEFVDQLYGSIITAGTYKAPSMKVAEAAKIVENCQRDVNISFVNELALIFDKMNIDTTEVLEAAGTKWNFLPFRPGLVGGHCIGVDPYYMIHKAESLGYHPALIGAGRRINDNMGIFVANKVVKLMVQKGIVIKGAKALILGITFKENCPDIRNTRVVDIYHELKDFGLEVDVYDPWADKKEVKAEYGIELTDFFDMTYDAVIIATAHDEFKNVKFIGQQRKNQIIFDTKNIIGRELISGRL
jgi:UDP-N-acetyl-D-galactosamine dehydrogenase